MMRDSSREEQFQRESERQFRRSVREATAVAFEEAVWMPPENVYTVLARELSERGIEPEPDAVYTAATLISRGVKPSVLRGEFEE